MMGGFANLRKSFENLPPITKETSTQEILQRFQLFCLFEIAGNLDTIAVEMREQTKIMRVNSERAEKQVQTFTEYAERLTKPVPVPSGFPAATGFGDPGKK